MSVVYRPICIDCIHLDLKKEKNGRPICKAYPDGIPYEVWKEKSKPDIDVNKTCNNGIGFEPEENNNADL